MNNVLVFHVTGDDVLKGGSSSKSMATSVTIWQVQMEISRM